MLSDFNFETRFGILSSWRIFLTPKLKKIENFIFWPPIEFPKLQRFYADPYTSQIELKFRIQCFGTIRQLLRHWHFALSKKSRFSLTPSVYACSLASQLMLFSDETRSRVLMWGEFFCFFFERLMYILMCYRNVLCLLNYKLLFRLAVVVLLGCFDFNPNVTSVRIHVC